MASRVGRLVAHVVAEDGQPTSPEQVFIVSAKRTPIGSNGGSLMRVSAVELGSIAIKACLEAAGVSGEVVQECIMGNVLSAGVGQAPARQAAVGAGLPQSACCTTVNKVCASGMKAVTLAAQSIMLRQAEVAIAGGMESMSNVPYYIPGQARAGRGLRYGDQKLLDGVAFDGLSDPWHGQAMGVYGDLCAREHGIGRGEQDEFSAQSYSRARAAYARGAFAHEIAPVAQLERGPTSDGAAVAIDEEIGRGKLETFAKLRPAFGKEGTVTAASSSKISDGAAALLLVGGAKARAMGLEPLARVVAFADAEQEPERFTTAPAAAIRSALGRARLRVEDIDLIEINEAFAVVVLANTKLLGIDPDKVNVLGGACALGHPIGCSGARILVTLCTALAERGGRYGLAAICNGGGGATAIVVERC